MPRFPRRALSALLLASTAPLTGRPAPLAAQASIVLPESVVLANPSVSSPAPMAGEAIDMSNANVATPVYSAPQDLQGVAPAQPAGSRLGPY